MPFSFPGLPQILKHSNFLRPDFWFSLPTFSQAKVTAWKSPAGQKVQGAALPGVLCVPPHSRSALTSLGLHSRGRAENDLSDVGVSPSCKHMQVSQVVLSPLNSSCDQYFTFVIVNGGFSPFCLN